MPLKYHSRPGFTLIGLMVLVAVLTILAAIAFAFYQNYMLTVRRVVAQDIMLNIQSLQEKHLFNFTF